MNIINNYINSGIPANSDDDLSYKVKFVNLFSVVGILAVSIFGVYRFILGDIVGSMIEIALVIGAIINVVVLRYTMRSDWASTVLLGSTLIVLAFLIITGGIHNDGLLWVYIFPALAFFLKGRRGGWLWMAYLGIIVSVILVLVHQGYISMVYEYLTIVHAMVALLAVSLVIYFFSMVNDQSTLRIRESTKELSTSNDTLSEEVEVRKSAEDALKSRTEELEKVNKLMVGRELRMLELKEELKELKKLNK